MPWWEVAADRVQSRKLLTNRFSSGQEVDLAAVEGDGNGLPAQGGAPGAWVEGGYLRSVAGNVEDQALVDERGGGLEGGVLTVQGELAQERGGAVGGPARGGNGGSSGGVVQSRVAEPARGSLTAWAPVI